MKTILMLAGILTFAVLPCPAQQSIDELAFEQATALYQNDHAEEALLAFYEFINVYPKSPLLGRAHFNIGYIQYERNRLEAALATFKQILDATYNEQDAHNIMEPYALYKHRSCRMLAEISLKQSDYSAAKEYIRLFDDVYPYQHFCGNEWSAYAMYTATMKARVFEGQGKIKNAVQALVPYTFSNALASNQHVLELLIGILERNYTKEDLRMALNEALQTLQLKKKNAGATILLFGKQVSLRDHFYPEDQKYDHAYYQALVKDNLLFRTFL